MSRNKKRHGAQAHPSSQAQDRHAGPADASAEGNASEPPKAGGDERNESRSTQSPAEEPATDRPSTASGTTSGFFGNIVKVAQDRMNAYLEVFEVQVALRAMYGLLSTIGMVCMIRESPTPIFRGWAILPITFTFILNILLALAVSNREIKICWVCIRSVTHWRFYWALVAFYPEHCLRAAVICCVASAYSYFFLEDQILDRKAWTCLISSLALVVSDTPVLRGYIWTGDARRKGTIQVLLGLAFISLLGGWRVYRWIALFGLFMTHDSLLTLDFHPSIGSAERTQTWLAGSAAPCALVYHWASVNGLPGSYATPVWVIVMLAILRARCPNDGVAAGRTLFICAAGTLLELYAFGMNAKVVVLVLGTLLYALLFVRD